MLSIKFGGTAWPKPFDRFFEYVAPGGLYLEFGVFTGSSIRYIAEKVPRDQLVHGFDSFEGLPERWNEMPAGFFKCDVPSNLPANVILHKGLFQDTLPQFLVEHPGRISLVHIDCDLYSSTKFVLDTLENLDDAVVVLDECFGRGRAEHEGLAFIEFLHKGKYAADFLGHHHSEGAGYRLRRRRE